MTTDLATLLHTRLDHEADQAPPEPALGDLIEHCERDLTRHRRRLIGAAVAAAGVVIAFGLPTFLTGSSTRSDDVASGVTLVDPGVDLDGQDPASLIEACKTGAQTQESTDLVFGPGTPRIVGYSNTIDQTSLVLVAADGSAWADCFNADKTLDGANTVMNVYIPRPSTIAPFSAGLSCPDQTPEAACDQFVIDKVDRLPADIAQVEFRTVDGVTTTIDTDQYGFVVFDYQGIPPQIYTEDPTPPRIPWITQTTYLDEAGNVLATNRWTDSTLQPQRVKGIPELATYPSLSLSAALLDTQPPAAR